jgi:hypothetical protein
MRDGLFASRSLASSTIHREPIGREHFLDHKLTLEQVNCKVKVFCGLGLISKDPSCLTDFDPFIIDKKAEYFGNPVSGFRGGRLGRTLDTRLPASENKCLLSL